MIESPKCSGREMIWLVRGLAFVLAGLVGGVACVALNQISPLAALMGRHLLGLPLAGALLWFGAATLRQVTTPGGAWRAATRRCLWSAVCVFFLSPFAYLWHSAPSVDYLTFNFAFFNLSSAVFVCNANRLTFWLAEFYGDRLLALLARGSELLCYSTLSFAVGASAVGTWMVMGREGLDAGAAADLLLGSFWPWLVVIGLAPVCVTAALLWTAKAISLARFESLASGARREDRN
ncbi:MAG: hypothetical protein NTY01_17030 [Verrucomicrobia bacterium]|nr:hypothetical protein [Verrucomicrobiota bacterium]